MKHIDSVSQCLVILITSILLIILLIIYSYNKKFNDKNIESFNTTTLTLMEATANPVINQSLINTINNMKPNVQAIQNIKTPIYNLYNPIKVKKYKDAGDFEISNKNFDFEEGKFSLNFYQELQDREIDDLNLKYNDIASQLKALGLKEYNNNYQYIKHNISGIKLRILNYNHKISDSSFNIMINNEKSLCIEYNALDPDIISNTPLHKTVNNIDKVACDKALDLTKLSSNFKSILQKQKFKFRLITNNNDYNTSLHENYNAFKVPDYYQLNNYPYYIIYPDNSLEQNDNMVLTISNGQISIEPSSGADNQKFTLLSY
jgi:hypothetical protein